MYTKHVIVSMVIMTVSGIIATPVQNITRLLQIQIRIHCYKFTFLFAGVYLIADMYVNIVGSTTFLV